MLSSLKWAVFFKLKEVFLSVWPGSFCFLPLNIVVLNTDGQIQVRSVILEIAFLCCTEILRMPYFFFFSLNSWHISGCKTSRSSLLFTCCCSHFLILSYSPKGFLRVLKWLSVSPKISGRNLFSPTTCSVHLWVSQRFAGCRNISAEFILLLSLESNWLKRGPNSSMIRIHMKLYYTKNNSF